MGASSGAARKPWVPGATCVMAAAAAEPTPSVGLSDGAGADGHPRQERRRGSKQLVQVSEQIEQRHLNRSLATTAPQGPETRRVRMSAETPRLHRGSRPGGPHPQRRPRRKPLRRRELPICLRPLPSGQVVAGGSLRTRASQARTPSPSRGHTFSKHINASDLRIRPGGGTPQSGKSEADWPSVADSVKNSKFRERGLWCQ
jgi:hypothetical protein